MASSTMAVAGSSAAVVPASVMECRSGSSPAFGSVRLAPVVRRSGAVKVNATVRASASEEPKAVRQAMVGLLAAGAILVSGAPGVPAYAGGAGPGGDGAASTAKQADRLLSKADQLTKDDSPPTFKQGVQNTGSTAKQAGSAASSNVQDVADAAVKNAKENLSKAKQSFGSVLPKGKVSDASGNKTYTVSDASGAINDAKRNASSAVDDAKDALSAFGNKISGNSTSPGDVASDVKNKATGAVDDAKSNLPNVPSGVEKRGGQKF